MNLLNEPNVAQPVKNRNSKPPTFPDTTKISESRAFSPKNRPAIIISIAAGQYAHSALLRYEFQIRNEAMVTNPSTKSENWGKISDGWLKRDTSQLIHR